ncbi:unnamed protein product [Orchesella dallaii]|uniref:RNase NYN domain-containing protein n=1 Tax=Orchesella dallaii TaxID=48710 RepID=A0ABP1Q851_9HEXA
MEGVKEAGSGGDILGGAAESEVVSGICEIDALEVGATMNVAISESETSEVEVRSGAIEGGGGVAVIAALAESTGITAGNGGGAAATIDVRRGIREDEGGVAANVALAQSTCIAAENGGGVTSPMDEDVTGGIEGVGGVAVSGGVSEVRSGAIEGGGGVAVIAALAESTGITAGNGGGAAATIDVRRGIREDEGGVAANVALAKSAVIAAENGGGGTSATSEGIEAEGDDAVSGGVSAVVVGAAGNNAGRRGRKRKDPSSTKKSYPKKPKTKKKEEIHDGETFNPADPESVKRLDGHAICLWKEDDGTVCMKVFYHDVKMSRHRTEEHWDRSFTCTNCRFTCKSNQTFRRHFLSRVNSQDCKMKEHWQVTDGKPHSIRKNVLVQHYVHPTPSTSSSAAADGMARSASSRAEGGAESQPMSPQPSTSAGGGAAGSSSILPDPSVLAAEAGDFAGSRIPIGEGVSGGSRIFPDPSDLAADDDVPISLPLADENHETTVQSESISTEALDGYEVVVGCQSPMTNVERESVSTSAALIEDVDSSHNMEDKAEGDQSSSSSTKKSISTESSDVVGLQSPMSNVETESVSTSVSPSPTFIKDVDSAHNMEVEAEGDQSSSSSSQKSISTHSFELVGLQIPMTNVETESVSTSTVEAATSDGFIAQQKVAGTDCEEEIDKLRQQLHEQSILLTFTQEENRKLQKLNSELKEEKEEAWKAVKEQEEVLETTEKDRIEMKNKLAEADQKLDQFSRDLTIHLEVMHQSSLKGMVNTYQKIKMDLRKKEEEERNARLEVENLQQECLKLREMIKEVPNAEDKSGIALMTRYVKIMNETSKGYESVREAIEATNYSLFPPEPKRWTDPNPIGEESWIHNRSEQQQSEVLSCLYGYFDTPSSSKRIDEAPRPCIIDGMNVVHAYKQGVSEKNRNSKRDYLGYMGLKVVVEYFQKKFKLPDMEIKIVLPYHNVYDEESKKFSSPIVEEFYKRKMIVAVPTRTTKYEFVHEKKTDDYDDILALNLARNCGGFVVSNDYFRDIWEEDSLWKATRFQFISRNRRITFRFEEDGGFFVFPGTKDKNKDGGVDVIKICRFFKETNEHE